MATRPGVIPAAETRATPTAADVVEYASLAVSTLATGQRRLDSETYLAKGYGIRLRIESALPFVAMAEMADIWQPSRLKGIQVAPEYGLPFFTATQVFDIRPTPRKWLAPRRTPNLERRFIEPGWILVTCSGSVGDAIISYAPLSGVIISHDLLRLQVKQEQERGYLYTFLRSHFGRSMLRSTRYGSIVKHLEPEHLMDIPIPKAAQSVRKKMDERMTRVFQLRDEAFRIMREAEACFAGQLGAAPHSDEWSYSVRASEMFGGRRRLDGYHYNALARAVLDRLKRSGSEVVPLSSLTKEIFGVPRFKHVYQDKGIPYLDSEDIFKMNPEIDKFIPGAIMKDAAKYYVERGWLLMASSGQLYGLNGSVVLADTWHEGKIVSNHVIRIVPGEIRPGYLAMALGHTVFGRPLVLRLAFGSEVPEIAPEDLVDFPIVRFNPSLEQEIGEKVERASSLRMEANREENAAVELLEKDLNRRLGSPLKVSERSLARERRGA